MAIDLESKRHMAFYRTLATSHSFVFVFKPLIARLSDNTTNYYTSLCPGRRELANSAQKIVKRCFDNSQCISHTLAT